MDMSFANQFMSQLRLAEAHKAGIKLEKTVIDLPEEQDSIHCYEEIRINGNGFGHFDR